MAFEAFDAEERSLGTWRVYSVGGCEMREEGEGEIRLPHPYECTTMASLLDWCEESGEPLWRYVEQREGEEIWDYLGAIWEAMKAAMERGLHAEGVLPGGLRLSRKSRSYLLKAKRWRESFQRTGLLSAYALAVSEENASGGVVVTAPTCGSSGVLPAVLRYMRETLPASDVEVLRALGTAGLVGNLVKTNASISGAEVGCQGEIGTACAMAAAAAAPLLGGLVQIPCIERNAVAAARALDCAEYALLSDGAHRVSFDQVIATMRQTGKDLQSAYRETSAGGLAAFPR